MSATEPGDQFESEVTGDQSAGLPGSRALSSARLFGGRREIVIVHRGQEYRLRITKADKLILTK